MMLKLLLYVVYIYGFILIWAFYLGTMETG